MLEAGYFAHAPSKFLDLADVDRAASRARLESAGMIYPIGLEAVKQFDTLFDSERAINSKAAAARQQLSMSLMTELHSWLVAQRAKLPRNDDLAKAIHYVASLGCVHIVPGRWTAYFRKHAAARASRCVLFGRRAWLFCGLDQEDYLAAMAFNCIETARLDDIAPQAGLADVIDRRIANRPVRGPDELLSCNWRRQLDAILP